MCRMRYPPPTHAHHLDRAVPGIQLRRAVAVRASGGPAGACKVSQVHGHHAPSRNAPFPGVRCTVSAGARVAVSPRPVTCLGGGGVARPCRCSCRRCKSRTSQARSRQARHADIPGWRPGALTGQSPPPGRPVGPGQAGCGRRSGNGTACYARFRHTTRPLF